MRNWTPSYDGNMILAQVETSETYRGILGLKAHYLVGESSSNWSWRKRVIRVARACRASGARALEFDSSSLAFTCC